MAWIKVCIPLIGMCNIKKTIDSTIIIKNIMSSGVYVIYLLVCFSTLLFYSKIKCRKNNNKKAADFLHKIKV